MPSDLPAVRARYRVDAGRLHAETVPLEAPGAAAVVVRVAGSALGRAPGAEIAGEVIAAGEAAREWLGRLVVVPRLLPCGDCELCRRGRAASCPRRVARDGLATHEVVPARYLTHLDERLWPADRSSEGLWRLAALADACAGPHAALVRAGCEPNQLVVVVGDGALARLAADVAAALGAHGVLVSPAAPADRAGLAAEARAHGASEEPWRVLVTDGHAASLALGAALCPDGGVVAWLRAEAAPTPALPLSGFTAREPALLITDGAHPDLLPELCALYVRGELPLDERTLAVEPGGAVATPADRLAILRPPEEPLRDGR
jgi:hypothetical protein